MSAPDGRGMRGTALALRHASEAVGDMNAGGACDGCLRRAALVADLGGHFEVEWRRRGAPPRVLALDDDALLGLDTTGRARARYASFGAAAARRRAAEASGAVTVRAASSGD